MNKTITKESIFEKICIASRLDNLGFFIGSGFSKAIMHDSNGFMPSWYELLKSLCNKYNIDDNIFKDGSTYPLIASKIVESVSTFDGIKNIEDAAVKVKESIANLVNIRPNNNVIENYREIFNEITPNWIVTTNYDSIIETIIGPKAYPILPNYLFYNTKNILPVYHIHGSILEPKSIVITNDDYARMMRPSDYRHSRLPILFKESTVLMIGYALGDINVISALDYRNNVYTNSSILDNCIIQLVYNEKIIEEKIYVRDNIYIYEYNSLKNVFNELCEYMKKYKSTIGKITKQVDEQTKAFICDGDDYIEKFVKNEDGYRLKTIEFINKLDSSYCYIFNSYIPFLNRVFNSIMSNARCDGCFSFYADYLEILLDIISELKVQNMPTVFLNFLIERFVEIAPSIGLTKGCSYAAKDLWDRRKQEIPLNFIETLKYSINSMEYVSNLDGLISDYLSSINIENKNNN